MTQGLTGYLHLRVPYLWLLLFRFRSSVLTSFSFFLQALNTGPNRFTPPSDMRAWLGLKAVARLDYLL